MEILRALSEGMSTSDVRKTKLRAIYAFIIAPTTLTGYAVAQEFLGDMPISLDDAGLIVSWVISGIGIISTIISTKRIGVSRPIR